MAKNAKRNFRLCKGNATFRFVTLWPDYSHLLLFRLWSRFGPFFSYYHIKNEDKDLAPRDGERGASEAESLSPATSTILDRRQLAPGIQHRSFVGHWLRLFRRQGNKGTRERGEGGSVGRLNFQISYAKHAVVQIMYYRYRNGRAKLAGKGPLR
jgi:hypothetical protein